MFTQPTALLLSTALLSCSCPELKWVLLSVMLCQGWGFTLLACAAGTQLRGLGKTTPAGSLAWQKSVCASLDISEEHQHFAQGTALHIQELSMGCSLQTLSVKGSLPVAKLVWAVAVFAAPPPPTLAGSANLCF